MQAYLLHARPVGEHSLLLDWLTLERGRLRTRQAGARRVGKKGSARPAAFCLTRIQTHGRGGWPILTQAEPDEVPRFYQGAALAAGFYLHELLIRALHPDEPVEPIFFAYHHTLAKLDSGDDLACSLRVFEREVLDTLGGAPDWFYTVDGEPVTPDGFYQLDPESGVYPSGHTRRAIPGRVLLALGNGQVLNHADDKTMARNLMRSLLRPHVGNAAFASRQLWPNKA
ncbi:MAG TPA: DNA repair protein RecO [Halothiobacillaceae bacterium]|nr:DNA repair protein RecO [Halothiobacillaceae bacterium]